jgi:hypothetical protein
MTTDRKRTSHILEQRREQGVEFVVVTFRHQQDKASPPSLARVISRESREVMRCATVINNSSPTL